MPRSKYPTLRYAYASILSLVALLGTTATPVERNLRGIPYYNFFTARDFDSGASSVFVTTASDGTVFYGDRNWISLYDGTTWHKVYQNSNTSEKITCLLWDEDGTIYAGGFNLFGELTLDAHNRPALSPLVEQDSFRNGEAVDQIESTPEAVFLTGRRSFACYDKASQELDLHVLSTWITATFFMGGEFHLLTDDNVILRYQNQQLVTLTDVSTVLNRSGITIADIAIDDDGSAIMASERKGIFRYDGTTLTRSYPNFKYSADHLTTDIERIKEDRLVVASLGGGLTVLDSSGNTIESLGPEADYRFQSARAITVDRSGAVWAMFNNSLAKILMDSPLTAIDERIRPSFHYASQHLHEGDLYVRSFYVLYKAQFDETGRISHFVNALEGSDLEIWSVAQTEDALYLNTSNHGIFRYDEGAAHFLLDSEAYDRFEHSKVKPQFLVGANSDSIALYEKDDDLGLRLVDKIENSGGFINRLHEDAEGNFWVEYGIGKVALIRIEDARIAYQVFGQEHGIPQDEWGSLWMHNGIPHLNTSRKTLLLDAESKPFKIDDSLQKAIGVEEFGIGRSFTDPQGNLWVSANNKNLIFWKQDDGSYRRDETTLSEMGAPYFESIEFLEDGDALIMTSFELFHFRNTRNAHSDTSQNLATKILRIEDPLNEMVHFSDLGKTVPYSPLSLEYDQNNLEFTVSNTFSYTTRPPQFQFRLEGFSYQYEEDKTPLDWNKSSTVTYTNLKPGNYSFKARVQLGNGSVGPWMSFPFTIPPPPYKTLPAYLLYLAASTFLILILIKFNSTRLRQRNEELEKKVQRRTREIEAKTTELTQQAELLESKNKELEIQSSELQQNARELANALIQLNDTQDKLLTTARIAGRAEVATNVLHSVGNVLNSVIIGLGNLAKQVEQSRARKLTGIVKMLRENENDLGRFLQSDERGKQIPAYLERLADALKKELDAHSTKIREIDENVGHIKNIIATQQSHAKKVGVEQEVHIAELLESALTVTLGESYESAYSIERNYDWDLISTTDKHLVLDVVINLIKNATESIAHLPPEERQIALSCRAIPPSGIAISISDNGSGIDPETQSQLFTHGFTTKPDGHGFGLHGSANAIKSVGGKLSLESAGPNQGATATITLPR